MTGGGGEKLRVVDLFCGGGGLSRGLMDAGLDVVAAFDHWPVALAFYSKNIPGHDVADIDLGDVDSAVERVRHYSPDVVAGGPPCQDFSSAGKRDESGGRADLTVSFASIVCRVRPRFFVMENVGRAQKSGAFGKATEMFKSVGYGLTESVLDASLCGVPQCRKRVIVFGVDGGRHDALIPVIRVRQAKRPMTVRDYLGGSLGVEFYYRHPRSYARRGVFGIDEPSPTVRGVNRPIPKGYPGHPGDPVPVCGVRPLTTKERSLIQTFPAEWDVSGPKADVEQIVGNAVPVKLAEFVGGCLLEYVRHASKYASVAVGADESHTELLDLPAVRLESAVGACSESRSL